VTYPDARVESLLATSFRLVRLDVAEREADTRRLVRAARPLWTPTLLFLDPLGIEVRRSSGYLPPEEFLVEAEIALGLVDLLHAKNDAARRRLSAVAAEAPEAHSAPEALFWAGIAAYRRDGQSLAVLAREWSALERRYPESTWWARADVFGNANSK
jgi:hypothetical protein